MRNAHAKVPECTVADNVFPGGLPEFGNLGLDSREPTIMFFIGELYNQIGGASSAGATKQLSVNLGF